VPIIRKMNWIARNNGMGREGKMEWERGTN
jgi:hypothetical protein